MLGFLVAVCFATWRRIGEEVHVGHSSEGFRSEAFGYSRSAFNDLIDLREVHRAEVWGPLAGGALPPEADKAVSPSAPESGSQEISEEGGAARKREERDHKAAERSEGKSSKPEEKRRRRSGSHRRTRSRSQVHSHKNEKSQSPSTREVKEEQTTAERSKPPLAEVRGEAAPGGGEQGELRVGPAVPASSRPSGESSSRAAALRSEEPPRRRSKEERREENEDNRPPPGRWTLTERPGEPSHARAFRPPEGPPLADDSQASC